jgi:hypothetical protein
MRKPTYRSINEVIDKEKDFEFLRKKAKEHDVVESFRIIFPDLANIAIAKKVEKNILFLRVENSVWRSELNFNKTKLTEKINKHFHEELIKSIKFI